MRCFLRKLVAALCAAGLMVSAAAQRPPRKAAPPKGVPQAPRKSALDKAAMEAYVRHLFVWAPPIQVTVSDPKPSSQLPGFNEVTVRAAAAGGGSQDELFYVSKDGQKILRGIVFDVAQNPFKPDLDKLKTEFQPSFGTPGATVVLVLFSDFQCPFCKEEAKMLRQNLLSAYPKQVRLYFKDFPLEQIHPWARMGSIAGRCIFRQNAAAYWQYYDWIFEHQAEITPENLKSKVLEFATGKEIDTLQLSRCLDVRATEAEVDKNVADARALQIISIPTVFVNGRRLTGQIGWPDLRRIIDYELEYQKTARNAGEDCGCEIKPLSPVAN